MFVGADSYPSGCCFVWLASLDSVYSYDSVRRYDLVNSATKCGEKDAATVPLLL